MTTTQTNLTDADELRSRATIPVPRAAEILGVSRATAYVLIRQGDLPSVNLGGKRIVVPTAPLRAMLGIED